MNILVCFHIIPDYSSMTQSQMSEIVSQSNLAYLDENSKYFIRVLSQYDESALEVGLKVGDQLDDSNISAVTLDRAENSAVIKKLLALPFSEITRIKPSRDIRFESKYKAQLLAEHIKNKGDIQVALCGMQSGESNNGMTGFLLAHQLGWPCISHVTDVVVVGSSQLRVTTKEHAKVCHYLVKGNAVLLIGNAASSSLLRVPTLKQKMAANKKSPLVCEGLVSQPRNTKLVSFTQRVSSRQKIMINSGTEEQRVSQALALLFDDKEAVE